MNTKAALAIAVVGYFLFLKKTPVARESTSTPDTQSDRAPVSTFAPVSAIVDQPTGIRAVTDSSVVYRDAAPTGVLDVGENKLNVSADEANLMDGSTVATDTGGNEAPQAVYVVPPQVSSDLLIVPDPVFIPGEYVAPAWERDDGSHDSIAIAAGPGKFQVSHTGSMDENNPDQLQVLAVNSQGQIGKGIVMMPGQTHVIEIDETYTLFAASLKKGVSIPLSVIQVG